MLEDKPDKGRAWLIAFAACIINMILSGISRMIGILFVAVLDEYGVSRQQATMPFSVRNSIRCMSGPVVGLVGLHFKVRNITFCGGIVATLGACLCSVAPNLMWLTIFWGVIHGLGFAFANTLFQVVVNQYFEKYRATASGIALSGACIGSLVFPFMFEVILEQYGLSGAFLILGGLVMNVLPPSILLVTPPWLNKSVNFQSDIHKPEDNTLHSETVKQELKDADLIEEIKAFRTMHSQSFSNCPTEVMEIASLKKSASFRTNKNALPPKCPFRRCNNKHPIATSNVQLNSTPEEKEKEYTKRSCVYDTELLSEKMPSSELEWSKENSCEKNFPQENFNQIEPPKVESNKVQSGVIWSIMSIFRLYQNPVFFLICLCMVAYIIIFIPMLAVIVDYGIDKGLSEKDGKYLISSMALGDLVGRLGFGWVTDRGLMTISNFMMTSLLLQGVVVILMPMANSFYALTGLLALYGVTAGSVLVLFPVLILKNVSLEDQPLAMGCSSFLAGLATFGLPPFIGHFRDDIGSYDGMFYITAAVSIISGILWLLEPVVVKYRNKKIQQNNLNR